MQIFLLPDFLFKTLLYALTNYNALVSSHVFHMQANASTRQMITTVRCGACCCKTAFVNGQIGNTTIQLTIWVNSLLVLVSNFIRSLPRRVSVGNSLTSMPKRSFCLGGWTIFMRKWYKSLGGMYQRWDFVETENRVRKNWMNWFCITRRCMVGKRVAVLCLLEHVIARLDTQYLL